MKMEMFELAEGDVYNYGHIADMIYEQPFTYNTRTMLLSLELSTEIK